MNINHQKNLLCIALDVNTVSEGLAIVDELKDQVDCFKVGMQLFTAAGPDIIKQITAKGCNVFLDLKYHDIPNTVAKAVEEASKLGVSYITIHLSGGSDMIKAAVNVVNNFPEGKRPMLLGVTVLTSMSEKQLQDELGIKIKLEQYVTNLIELGLKNGLTGFVCSPADLPHLKKQFKEVFFATPGMRPSWASSNDQSRTSTPGQAIKNGSSLLILGRPVLEAENRKEAVEKILKELS